MRQSGHLAAPGIIALNGLVNRLVEDHKNAKILAKGLAEIKGVILNPKMVKTNIIFFSLNHPTLTSEIFINKLEAKGIRILMTHHGIFRAVLHREISAPQIKQIINVLTELIK